MLHLFLCLLLPLVTAAPIVRDLSQNITSDTGDIYNVLAMNGTLLTYMGREDYPHWNVSLGQTAISHCGLCTSAGFCEYEESWSNCVGEWFGAVGLPQGEGVELSYHRGEFSRVGVVRISCDLNAAAIVAYNVTTVDTITVMAARWRGACPIASTAPLPLPVAVTNCSLNITSPTGDVYNIASLVGSTFSTFDDDFSYWIQISICSNSINFCGSCLAAAACFETNDGERIELCGGLFYSAVGLPAGQGLELLFNASSYNEVNTLLLLHCDPTLRIILPTLSSYNGALDLYVVTAQGLPACPVGTQFQPEPEPSPVSSILPPTPPPPPTPTPLTTYESLVGAGIISANALLLIAVVLLIVLIVRFVKRRAEYSQLP